MIQTDLHGLRGPMCKICFKPFASPQTLARHIEVQHIDSGVPYPCHYCEKIFKNKSHRSVHVHREHRAEHREYLDSKQQHNLTNLPPNWPSKTNTEIFHGHQNKSHLPFPFKNWHEGKGSCLDHMKRKKLGEKEVLMATIVNLTFNMVMLIPLVILRKI